MQLTPTPTKIICFFLSLFSYQFAFTQADHTTTKELLIIWSNQRSNQTKSNLTKILPVEKIEKLTTTGIELWTLSSHQHIDELIARHKHHPGIESIEPNLTYFIDNIEPNDAKFDQLWSLHNTGQQAGSADADINALGGWKIQNESRSIGVAIIDTGVDWGHEDLTDNIWQNLGEDFDQDGHVLEWDGEKMIFDPGDENGIDDDGNGYVDDFVGWDFKNNDNNPYDDQGHGTHVAGIIGANGNNKIGVVGVTWQVQMAAIKFIGKNRGGKTSDAIRAIDYVKKMGFPISNLSWGGSHYSRALLAALKNTNEKEQLFVIAAGNNGLDNDKIATYPASYQLDNIISVAATNRNDQLSSLSNYGATSVDIVAPGIDIFSTFPNNKYGTYSGTSMAAPHVTGACALLWEYAPDKSATIIKQDLLKTADPLPAINDKILTGGRLNLERLLEGPTCQLNDSLTLVAFYQAMDGQNWVNSWDLTQPVATWYGVTTNYGGCVTALNLPDNNLVGVLPDNIGDFSNLSHLNLAANQINGAFPAALNRLANNLLYLNLAHNQLRGALRLSIFRHLKTLNLSNNQFSGRLPPEIYQFNRIEVLDLSSNKFSGMLSFSFDYLKQLHTLDLSYNQLIGKLPHSLTKAIKLQKIRLNNNQFEGCFPVNYTDLCKIDCDFSNNLQLLAANNFSTFCTDLTNACMDCVTRDSLALVALYQATDGANWNVTWDLSQPMATWYGINTNENGCVDRIEMKYFQNLSGNIPPEIGNLYHLVDLELQGQNIVGGIPNTIGQLVSLKRLVIQATSINQPLPTEIGNLINLQTLHLFSNQLSGELPASINRLSNLYQFNVGQNKLTGELPKIIRLLKAPKLLTLGLSSNQFSGEIPSTIKELPSLKSLVLRNNHFTGTLPVELGALPNLHTLDLSRNQFSGTLPAEIGKLSNLTMLDLSHNQLAGCFPDDYSIFCAINSDFTKNINLPNAGDFDVFCATETQICETAIWPGDFNNDGVANNVDMLYWGLACEGTRGPRRPNASIDWEAQNCPEWSSSVGEVNNKYQDGNGDGIINVQDLQVLADNYGLTHRFSTIQSPANDLAFELVPLGYDTTSKGLKYELYLKEKELSDNTHGVACTINFGNLPILSTDFKVANSFLSPDQQLIKFNKTTNTLDLALTRTDKKGQKNDAPLGILIIIIDNLIFEDPILLGVEQGHKLSTNGTLSTIEANNAYTIFSEISSPAEAPEILRPKDYSLDVFPNPIQHQAKIIFNLPQSGNVDIQLHAISGNKITTIMDSTYKPAEQHEFDFSATNHPEGLYFISLKTANTLVTKKILLVH